MNQKQIQYRRNEALRFIDRMSRINLNACNFNSGNTDLHEDIKWRLFKEFRRQGSDVVTEAKFLDGSGRADIVVLDTFTIFEVAVSESEESIQEKVKKYPLPFKIFVARPSSDCAYQIEKARG